MQFRDNLEMPGGNTRRQTKVEVGLGYCSIEDKCLNLHRKWYLKEDMVGTTIAKDQFTDTRWYLLRKWLLFQEASMIGYTSRPWAWTQGSRSTPTSPKHNLTFTSRFDNGISVESYTWWNTRWVWLVKSSEFTHIKEGIGSTHPGILRTYTTNFGVINTSSKVEHCWSSRGYNVPKALCIRGKSSQGD